MIKRIGKTLFPERIVESLKVLKNGPARDPMGKPTYDQDGLRTIHNCDFILDPAFERAYQAGEQLGSWFGGKVHWRVHTLFWAATRALQLEGDFVECGVHRGGFSKAIIEYVDFARLRDRNFYLLDTFEGMSETQLSEEEVRGGLLEYPYSAEYESVKDTFAEYPNVSVIKGRIPESLAEVSSEKVSFLSIDLNNAVPEIAAAEFFWSKLVSGAAVVLDDYGWEKHIVQKRAFDDFALRHRVPILSLPTGQGLIIKP